MSDREPAGREMLPIIRGDQDVRKQKGFSLIELLIVVAIILIIAAIAIPNLLRARIAANESSAVGSVRTVNTAQITYSSTYSTAGYASSLANLAGSSCSPPTPTSSCLIDSQLGGGSKSGYSFGISNTSGTPISAYNIIAAPLQPNQSGVRYFCSFADAVVRFNATTAISTCGYAQAPLN